MYRFVWLVDDYTGLARTVRDWFGWDSNNFGRTDWLTHSIKSFRKFESGLLEKESSSNNSDDRRRRNTNETPTINPRPRTREKNYQKRADGNNQTNTISQFKFFVVNSFFCVNWRLFWKCEFEKSSLLIINLAENVGDFQVCSVYQDERDVISSRSVVNKTYDGLLNYSTRTVRVVIIMAWKLLLFCWLFSATVLFCEFVFLV